MNKDNVQISNLNKFIKRLFDIIFSFLGLLIAWWIILITYLIIRFTYKESGFYKQNRIGLHGKEFKIIKLKSMKKMDGYNTFVTTKNDPRITPIGKFIRRSKIDELPQLFNVLKGDMSFVGPRPDVKGVVDTLTNYQKKIYTSVRPGITGPATLKYRDEETLLSSVKNPELYNIKVIFKDKYEINRNYIENYSLKKDIHYILKTILKK